MLPQKISSAEDDRTENEPRTLYFTLSLYADQKDVRAAFSDIDNLIDSKRQIFIQSGYRESLKLRDAIEPLLNDITDRERESRIEDFFLSTSDGLKPETIEITVPAKIRWSTEGIQFSAVFDGDTSKKMNVRTFWYIHSNGAISYHMSFICRYEHSARDFYFMSMLQKACAPKEFKRDLDEGSKTRDVDFLDPESGVFPLDAVRVTSHQTPLMKDLTFWNYVKECFNRHAFDLFNHPRIGIGSHDTADYFTSLVRTSNFIEVPGLEMPNARYLFLFDDAIFFEALSRKEKEAIRSNAQLSDIAKEIGAMIEKAKRDHGAGKTAAPTVDLDNGFLSKCDKLDVALRYYFLSGFCQNIIDFMNQDASEIRDSLDPIYPTTPEQEEENFFFRFANPRSMTQIVPGSRSLNIGNDFIGTCPYAFLIHVASLHNEFLTRSFESEVARLKASVERKTGIVPLGATKDYAGAAREFYDFRTRTLADYIRYRYENVFRYDTEGDCFTSLEKVRGVSRKTTYLNEMVTNLQSTTRDLEERQRRDDADLRDRNAAKLNFLVLVVGGFSILQVVFQVLEFLKPRDPVAGIAAPRKSVLTDYVSLSDWTYNAGGEALSIFSLILTAIILIWAMAMVIPSAVTLLKKSKSSDSQP